MPPAEYQTHLKAFGEYFTGKEQNILKIKRVRSVKTSTVTELKFLAT